MKKPYKLYSFSRQNCQLTLREGLEEYYQKNPSFEIDIGLLGMPINTVKAHDVAHVVFGLGTSSAEELLLETRTFFGCQIGVKTYAKVIKQGFIIELLKMFGPLRLIRRFVLTFPKVFQTALQCILMKKKWPHFGYENYLDTLLYKIREEFGIKVITVSIIP